MSDEKIICVICNKEINLKEGFINHPEKPMHIECYAETPEGKASKERRDELEKNPFVKVSSEESKKNIPKRYCWFHRNDLGEKIPAICYWYTVDGGSYHACEGCAGRYGKDRKIHWYGERTGSTSDTIEPFDEDCDHNEYKKNMVSEFDDHGSYDIIACRKCGGQRKRRFGRG